MAKAQVTLSGFLVYRLRTKGPEFLGMFFSRESAEKNIKVLEEMKEPMTDFAIAEVFFLGQDWANFQTKGAPKLEIVAKDDPA
jgi:hypothetical protein